jgi:serine/threonine protein kinase/tetratricopeptide (TPR) repeat protein
MQSFAQEAGWRDLEAIVDAFEEAQVRNGRAELIDFLPPPDHPNRREVLCELVRVDLEYRWQRGDSRSIDSYRSSFPELFDDPGITGQVEFEVDRLRRRSIDESAFPEVGDDFLGFRLIAELGRGAFGRVYLAEQEGLANRNVALKVSKSLFGESQTLAQLQHTNIVPIHSVHMKPPFHAVCMPYFGGTTLADALKLLRGGSSPPASGLGLLSTLRSAATFEATPAETPGAARPAGQKVLDERDRFPSRAAAAIERVTRGAVPSARLAGLNYVEAVLWIVSRLADALDHAHARGVLHRDLKPANILLTTEGQPMLLDFNLSAGEAAAAVRVGGTLPYMSPEQVAAIDGQEVTLEAASDVYSLGIVLYELLSLRHPFPMPKNVGPAESLAQALADRRRGPPTLRPLNRAVSPAVESIVRHALETDRAHRYRSAAELQEDIERHLEHRPLKYAREASRRERAAKWIRRHPRLAPTAAALVAFTMLATAGGAWRVVERREARLSALEQFRRFESTLMPALYRLNGSHTADQFQRGDALVLGKELLASYHVENDGHWRNRPAVAGLDEHLQRKLAEGLGGLSLSIADATAVRAVDTREIEDALHWNHVAERGFEPETIPRVLWTQRADLLRRLDRNDDAAACEATATDAPTRPVLDHFWDGIDRSQRHDHRAAISAFEAAIDEDPSLYWGWFQLGLSHLALGQNSRAAQCYTVCIALLPDSGEAYYHRGLARLFDDHYAQALADFDKTVRLLPDFAGVYLDRGEARLALNEPKVAVVEFTQAIEMGADAARALLTRSKARRLAGDAHGAESDLSAGLAARPSREEGWVAHGMARLPADPAGALADYAQALKLAPCYLPALQNSAAVLAELPGHADEAIEMLNLALEVSPSYADARIGRAVLLARDGRREAALADARQALAYDQRPSTFYQAACAYALISHGQKDDRREALRLLAAALAGGFGREYIAVDHDLDALRGDEEFHRLIER